jgi:Flp pilus assembly protein TadB
MNEITTFLHTSTAQTVITILMSLVGAYIAYVLASSLRIEKSTSRRLRQAAGVEDRGLDNELGNTLLRYLKLDTKSWESMLDWAQLSGQAEGWSTGTLMGRMVLYGAAGFAAVFLITRGEKPLFLLAALLAAVVPYFNVKEWAEQARKRVKDEVPEMAALLAAELSAGSPAMVALQRTSALPGILSKLIKRAFEMTNSTGTPVFSTPTTRGTLLQVMMGTKVSVLTALSAQLDLVARKGSEAADLMTDIGKSIAIECYEEKVVAAETMESALILPSTVFYFLPLIIVVMLPLMQMIGQAF